MTLSLALVPFSNVALLPFPLRWALLLVTGQLQRFQVYPIPRNETISSFICFLRAKTSPRNSQSISPFYPVSLVILVTCLSLSQSANGTALDAWCSWSMRCPMYRKVAGLIPDQHLHSRQTIDVSLLHWCFSFSLSLKSINISSVDD